MTLTRHTVQEYGEVEKFIEEHHPEMAILAVPKEAMHQVAQELIGYGIRAFLNFSYTELPEVDENITVENVHLGDSLMRLSYKLVESDRRKKESEEE